MKRITDVRRASAAGAGLVFVATVALSAAGCGGGRSPQQGTVADLRVTGNAPAVDGREQIVAANNNGVFQVAFDVPTEFSQNATVMVADRADHGSERREEKIIDVRCNGDTPCTFNVRADCRFTPDNRIQCSSIDEGDGPVDEDLPVADLTPLMTGNSTDLYVILEVRPNAIDAVEQAVPVTLRYQ
ncbi:MAG TPA: hypothetical protein VNX25_02145 [Verrucomicrobiae bacterium]|nr:hypothetical protein [Verrucomicrobiae bacterium]